jgi:hypothetical protein
LDQRYDISGITYVCREDPVFDMRRCGERDDCRHEVLLGNDSASKITRKAVDAAKKDKEVRK